MCNSLKVSILQNTWLKLLNMGNIFSISIRPANFPPYSFHFIFLHHCNLLQITLERRICKSYPKPIRPTILTLTTATTALSYNSISGAWSRETRFLLDFFTFLVNNLWRYIARANYSCAPLFRRRRQEYGSNAGFLWMNIIALSESGFELFFFKRWTNRWMQTYLRGCN